MLSSQHLQYLGPAYGSKQQPNDCRRDEMHGMIQQMHET